MGRAGGIGRLGSVAAGPASQLPAVRAAPSCGVAPRRAHSLFTLARPWSRPSTWKPGSWRGRSRRGASGQPSKSGAVGHVASASSSAGRLTGLRGRRAVSRCRSRTSGSAWHRAQGLQDWGLPESTCWLLARHPSYPGWRWLHPALPLGRPPDPCRNRNLTRRSAWPASLTGCVSSTRVVTNCETELPRLVESARRALGSLFQRSLCAYLCAACPPLKAGLAATISGLRQPAA